MKPTVIILNNDSFFNQQVLRVLQKEFAGNFTYTKANVTSEEKERELQSAIKLMESLSHPYVILGFTNSSFITGEELRADASFLLKNEPTKMMETFLADETNNSNYWSPEAVIGRLLRNDLCPNDKVILVTDPMSYPVKAISWLASLEEESIVHVSREALLFLIKEDPDYFRNTAYQTRLYQLMRHSLFTHLFVRLQPNDQKQASFSK